ncbi:hypothetical protein [Streptomyces bobili]|uniref:Uncharacterized protein n=1 Tax=Streptomyces bobili TaxID=67280 RepID=A0ABZ1QTE4_9ACTN|nr:hypothetical protein [Streptomyces bobili]
MVWLLIFILVIVLQGPIQNGFGAGAVLGTIVLFLVATGVWLWTQLLLANRVSWLVLLPGALLAAAATSALSLAARVYMPRALSEYGSFGLVRVVLS